jgi:ubiquinone/menaquinone biosynthesis C-methylase UbiE
MISTASNAPITGVVPDKKLLSPLADPDLQGFVRLHYLPFSRIVYRKRLQIVIDLMNRNAPYQRGLEIGFGPGFLLPALARSCREVVAVDIHEEAGPVGVMLRRQNVTGVSLMRNSISELAFRDASFDLVVSMSVLEHIHRLDAALREIARVVRQHGTVVLGFPVKSRLTDSLFKALGYEPDDLHPNSHASIIGAAGKVFRITGQQHYPEWAPLNVSLYSWITCEKP